MDFMLKKKKGGKVPRVNPGISLSIMKKLTSATGKGFISSAHDCSEGGMAVCLAEMLFSGGLGAECSVKKMPRAGSIQRDDVLLFSESNSRFIVEVEPAKKEQLPCLLSAKDRRRIGITGCCNISV